MQRDRTNRRAMEIDRMNKNRRPRQYQPDRYQGAEENEINMGSEDIGNEYLLNEGILWSWASLLDSHIICCCSCNSGFYSCSYKSRIAISAWTIWCWVLEVSSFFLVLINALLLNLFQWLCVELVDRWFIFSKGHANFYLFIFTAKCIAAFVNVSFVPLSNLAFFDAIGECILMILHTNDLECLYSSFDIFVASLCWFQHFYREFVLIFYALPTDRTVHPWTLLLNIYHL
jgi:hypothetical protein